MKYLFLDTSTSHMIVSIIDENKIVYNYQENVISDMSSKIIPIIEKGFNSINFSINDIDKIFVVNGPGSFTGIRVGVTVAKTISWALKKIIVPISSLELLATTKTDKEYLVPMIDARRGNVYAAIYDSKLNNIKKEKLYSIDEFKNLDLKYELVSYDKLSVEGIIKPNVDLIRIINKHENDIGINPHNLNPNYLKLTEAEENKKNDN